MFSRVGQVPAGLLQARFVQAGLHAAVHAARRAFRAAVHAARDAAPCRPSGPPCRWVELRARTRPPIQVRETCFAVRPFSIPFLDQVQLLDFGLATGWRHDYDYRSRRSRFGEAKPPGSSPPMQKLGKFTTLRIVFSGMRWRVADGASPNLAR